MHVMESGDELMNGRKCVWLASRGGAEERSSVCGEEQAE